MFRSQAGISDAPQDKKIEVEIQGNGDHGGTSTVGAAAFTARETLA